MKYFHTAGKFFNFVYYHKPTMKQNGIAFLLAFMIFFMLKTSIINAQQWHYFNPTMWYDVNTVDIRGPGVIAIGGGWEKNDSTQIMMQTTDYGLNWYENAHDGLAPWNKSIAFSDSLNGFGVGYDGRIIRTDDAGMNWGWAVAPMPRDLNKIVYAGYGVYYIVGGNSANDSTQTVIKSTDNGNAWGAFLDGPGPWLKSAYFSDTTHGFIIGNSGVIKSTTDGGSSWTTIIPPVIRDFNSITFINADTGYIAGGNASGTGTILRTADGGANWTVIKDGSGGELNDISFADPLQGYVVGDSATVLHTADGGLTWGPVVVDPGLTGNEEFRAVKFYDPDFGVIAGKAGVLYVYVNYPQPLVQTLNASLLSSTMAELRAGINTNNINSQYTFCYSTDSLFSTFSTSTIQNISSTSNDTVSAIIMGLLPDTAYYYYVKAQNITGTVYGDTLSFSTHLPYAMFFTNQASNITWNSAQLNGTVQKFSIPVSISFEYGLTLALGSEIIATPAFVNDTFTYSVTAQLYSLLHDTIYYFRLKGITSQGTFYGNTVAFTTSTAPHATTLSASQITLYSARLYGMVNSNHHPTTIEFEYGTTTGYGNTIAAIPPSTTDTNDINVYADISGLLSNTTYHFRCKASSISGTSYGSDRIFYTGFSEIPNFDFEYWDTVSTLVPDSWDLALGNITMDNSSCHGNYGVRLENDTISPGPGAVLIGKTADGISFTGGTPINSRPDTLIGCFNYSVAPGDSALVLLFLKKQGTFISSNLFKITGNSSGNFKVLKFPINYSTSDVPDSMIIGVSCSDFRTMQYADSGSNMIVDYLRFSGSSDTIPNADFERWHNHNRIVLNTWWYNRKNIPLINESEVIVPTTDAVSGNYAVFLQSLITPTDTECAYISTGKKFGPQFPVNGRHQNLTGYFKYFPVNNDTMRIDVAVYKNGQIISWSRFLEANTYSSYTPFIIDINYYNDTIIPDSAQIQISTSFHNPRGNSALYVDNLNFDGFFTNIENPYITTNHQDIDLNVYPNPFNTQATVAFTLAEDKNINISVFDMTGKQITLLANGRYKAGGYTLNLPAAGLNRGLYFCVITSGEKIITKKIIVY